MNNYLCIIIINVGTLSPMLKYPLQSKQLIIHESKKDENT